MTDSEILIAASNIMALAALALIVTLWANRRLYERQPKLMTLAVWCMIAAVTAMIVAEVGR